MAKIPRSERPELLYILDKYGLDQDMKSPIAIPNTGRDDLARLFSELDYKVGVEVGVERGVYSQVLCQTNPQATIYGVDIWKPYRGYRDHVSRGKLDGFFEKTQMRMGPYTNYHCIRKFSMEAVKDFEPCSLDFVYIDANHTLPYVLPDIMEWSKRVRVGGMVAGHDYRESVRLRTNNHVVYAVNCYTRSYRICPWFLFGRKGDPGRDDSRSWGWVKEQWQP
jgi:hypothetical protein